MADDIRIKVGVASNVKAGMDGVVRDLDKSGARIAKGLGGRSFADALTRALRGDIAGAIEQASATVMESSMALGVKMAGAVAAGFAGYNLGKALDARFGLSDKLGNMMANKFGTAEDPALKAKLDQLRALNAERYKADEQAAAMAKRDAAWQDEAIQREIRDRIDGIEQVEAAKAAAKEESLQGVVADMNREKTFADAAEKQAQADRLTQMAFDPSFRRQEQAAARQSAREAGRRSRLERMAGILSPEDAEGMTAQQIDQARKAGERARRHNPMLRRIWDADQARQEARNAQENIDQLQRRAYEAQLQAAVDNAETAKNTRELAALKPLLAMK